jgi:hypothetical protein
MLDARRPLGAPHHRHHILALGADPAAGRHPLRARAAIGKAATASRTALDEGAFCTSIATRLSAAYWSAKRSTFRARVGVADGRAHKFGELRNRPLGLERQRLGFVPRGPQQPSYAPADHDRAPHGRADTELATRAAMAPVAAEQSPIRHDRPPRSADATTPSPSTGRRVPTGTPAETLAPHTAPARAVPSPWVLM